MSQLKNGINGFLDLCLHCKDRKALDELLTFFLTQEEKTNIANRFLITNELLKNEKTQRDIAKKLKVSIAKITRGSNELKRTHPELLRLLTEHIKK